jgi:hypothetical protein
MPKTKVIKSPLMETVRSGNISTKRG